MSCLVLDPLVWSSSFFVHFVLFADRVSAAVIAEMDEQSYGIENQIGAKLSGIRKEYDDFGKLCAVILFVSRDT